YVFFFQAEDGIRDFHVTGVQTCALPILDAEESAATAVATAGGSVVFAGVTVMIALAGLLIVGIPFLGLMGVTAAFAVLLAMLAAITLLPAILGLLKGWLAPKPGSRAALRAQAHDDDETRAPVRASASEAASASEHEADATPAPAPRRRKTLG